MIFVLQGEINHIDFIHFQGALLCHFSVLYFQTSSSYRYVCNKVSMNICTHLNKNKTRFVTYTLRLHPVIGFQCTLLQYLLMSTRLLILHLSVKEHLFYLNLNNMLMQSLASFMVSFISCILISLLLLPAFQLMSYLLQLGKEAYLKSAIIINNSLSIAVSTFEDSK